MSKHISYLLTIMGVLCVSLIYAQPGGQMMYGEININLNNCNIQEGEVRIYIDTNNIYSDINEIDFNELPKYLLDTNGNFTYSLGRYLDKVSVVPKCNIYISISLSSSCNYYFLLNGYLSKNYILNEVPKKTGQYQLLYNKFYNSCEHPLTCYILSPVKLKK